MAVAFTLATGFEAGVGVLAARAYDASWNQATVFTATYLMISIGLCAVTSSSIQNTRQLCLVGMVTEAISCLTGVLMTRLFCEKAIHWKQALAAYAISGTAVNYICPIFMTPVLLKKA